VLGGVVVWQGGCVAMEGSGLIWQPRGM
jgi:hypothetical protein